MSISNNKPRVNFASVRKQLPYPDFLEIQLKSFKDFLQLDTPPEKRNNEASIRYLLKISLLQILVIILCSSFLTIISIHLVTLLMSV